MPERNYHTAYLLIGGNMGNRMDMLRQARLQLERHCGDIKQVSSIYETAPWGNISQENFFNQAVELKTKLSPAELLHAILNIEKDMGRRRDVKYGPRIIDIDILLYDDQMLKTDELTLPHPEIQNRRFALVPLAEIAPEVQHPQLEKDIITLLGECSDLLEVKKIEY